MRASKRVAALILSAGLATGGFFVGTVAAAQSGDNYIPVTTGGQPSDPGDPADPGDPGGSTSSTAASSESSLPFTGGDVVGLLVVGGAVLGTGLAVRAVGKRRSDAETA